MSTNMADDVAVLSFHVSPLINTLFLLPYFNDHTYEGTMRELAKKLGSFI